MKEEEARLKALLEQTEDFDERRKIRADLRAVRKKMLDSLSATAEAESNERAARRAERAKARKAEEDANRYTGPAITEQILSEMDDEETLQTLLNEIPTSQIEDRRRIRARIRELKRQKEEEPTSRRTRRTRETTETSEETSSTRERRRYRGAASDESIESKPDESSSVTVETISNDASHVTIPTMPNDGLSITMETKSEEPCNESANEISNEPANEVPEEPQVVTVETNSDEPSGISIKMNSDDKEIVTIETTSANHVDEDSEIKFKLTLRQSKDIQLEQDTDDTVEQSPDIEIDQAVEVRQEEPAVTPVEVKIGHSGNEKVETIDDDGNLNDVAEKEFETVGAPQDESAEEKQQETQEEDVETQATVGEGISLEFKIDSEVNLNIEAEAESQDQPGQDSEVKETENVVEAPVADVADGGHISKDKRSESSASNASKEDKPSKTGSKWPPPGDEKKKSGRVNQVDFRNNLKKSGKIAQGKGVVNLEKKNNTAGAQVDFRNLKKSGRIGGGGAVNLENKVSTQGAQVDFRSGNLKSSGKIGGGTVNLERKTNTTGAQVDFRGALKKGGSPAIKSGGERMGSFKSETPPTKDSKKSQETVVETPAAKMDPVEKEIEAPEVEETSEAPAEDNVSKEEEPPVSVQITVPPPVQKKVQAAVEKKVPEPVEKKPPAKEPKAVRGKNKKSSVRNEVETTRNEVETTRNEVETTRNEAKSTQNESKTVKKEAEPVQNGTEEDDIQKDGEIPAQVDINLDVKIDNVAASPAPSVNNKEPTVDNKEAPKKDIPGTKGKTEFKYKPRDSYKTREDAWKTPSAGGKSKVFDKLSKFQAKDETTVKPKGYTPRSSQKKEPAPAADKAVNGITVKVENTSITAKEPESPVQIEVTEHVEDDGETHTEVREETTTKQDGAVVEEKKEVRTTTKTTTADGGKMTTKTMETRTKKTFMDPELQKRMAQRQRDRANAKREQASSAKNKRMAFMQKLEANSPAQNAPSNVKRSGSNVDKLLAWCRFKLRTYEGVKLNNFSSSWADGLAFCALMHLYVPEKVPYEELLAAGDKKRNFETAFSVATEAGVPELLEVEDMLSVTNPEPKSVMTYVSSIYKHFNPS